MNIDYELLQYYVYKKVIKKKDADDILADCERLKIPLREYLLTKEYITEAGELDVLSEYYNIPAIELEMLEIDKSLFDQFSFEYMKANKFIPVSIDKKGVLLVAIGRMLDVATMTSIAVRFACQLDFVLTPPTQIDRYIDSIAAVITTSAALNDLNAEKDEKLFSGKTEQIISFREDDVINNPAVRLVDSIIRRPFPTERVIYISNPSRKRSA